MTSELKSLVQGWVENGWNCKDLNCIERYFTEDFVGHDPYQPKILGREGAREFVAGVHGAFSGLEIRVDDMVAEDDLIACRLTVKGRHEGEFMGYPPTHVNVTYPAMALWRIRDGRFCDVWQHWDAFGVLRQIGRTDESVSDLATLVFDPGEGPPTTEDVDDGEKARNKETVNHWMDGAWNHGHLKLANDLFTDDVWFWDPSGPPTINRAQFCDWATMIDNAFPLENRSLSIDRLIAEGNKTAYRVTLRGVHGGDFLRVKPTQRCVSASALIMVVHEGSRFKKAWQIFDVLRVLRQLGQKI